MKSDSQDDQLNPEISKIKKFEMEESQSMVIESTKNSLLGPNNLYSKNESVIFDKSISKNGFQIDEFNENMSFS